MAVNVIVAAVTLMMGAFVTVWLLYPRCRAWIEAPKWQPLRWDRPLEAADELRPASAQQPVSQDTTARFGPTGPLDATAESGVP
jgi:hypothetical protein